MTCLEQIPVYKNVWSKESAFWFHTRKPKTSDPPVVLCRISFPQRPNTPEIQPTWTRSGLDLVDLQRAATASRHRHREGLCDQDLALSESGVENEDVLFLEGSTRFLYDSRILKIRPDMSNVCLPFPWMLKKSLNIPL